jgi:threonyl-tRNA synthetase
VKISIQTRLDILRQTAAQVIAFAVCDLFPEAQLIQGAKTNSGFYVDFATFPQLHDNFLSMLEEKVFQTLRDSIEISYHEMMSENAKSFFSHKKQGVVADFLDTYESSLVGMSKIKEFYCLSDQKVLQNTSEIKALKLLKIEEITAPRDYPVEKIFRITGTACLSKRDLKEHLKKTELEKKRDHRKFGRQDQLFDQQPGCGNSLWMWFPKGTYLRKQLLKQWDEECTKHDILNIHTPTLCDEKILEESGIDGFLDESQKQLKLLGKRSELSMCSTPELQHALVYRALWHSYKELPVRFAECKEVLDLREKNNEGNGLLRSKQQTVDTTTAFINQGMALKEVKFHIERLESWASQFSMKIKWTLFGKGDQWRGTNRQWKFGEELMEKAMKDLGKDCDYFRDTQCFSGPSLVLEFIDSIGRSWQMSSIRFDFHLPQSLSLRYQNNSGEIQPPLMVVVSFFQSLEKMLALIVEHYEGKLPLWLSSEHVRVIPVAGKHISYANKLKEVFEEKGIRSIIEKRDEKLSSKVHHCLTQGTPYLLIVGDEEENNETLTVRKRDSKEIKGIKFDKFIRMILNELKDKQQIENFIQILKEV